MATALVFTAMVAAAIAGIIIFNKYHEELLFRKMPEKAELASLHLMCASTSALGMIAVMMWFLNAPLYPGFVGITLAYIGFPAGWLFAHGYQYVQHGDSCTCRSIVGFYLFFFLMKFCYLGLYTF